jgi:hypothetical protein
MWAGDQKGGWFDPDDEAPSDVVGRDKTGQPCGHSLRERRTFPTLVFVVGLVSPLTPSEGRPTLWEWLLFAVLPIALLACCVRASRSRVGAVFFGGQALAIITFSVWLLVLFRALW